MAERNPSFDKQLAFGQYEYVDVIFPPLADTDITIRYSILQPEDTESVRWLDITPSDGTGDGEATGENTRSWGFQIDGGGSAITTGLKGFSPPIPFAGTITKVTLLSSDGTGPALNGSIVIDIWKDTYANYPPTIADTITASAKPTLSTSNKYQDSTLAGWATAVNVGDVFGWNVDSASTIIRATVNLEITTESTLQFTTPPRIYRPTASQRPFGQGYIVLRCTAASYKTRLLLFLER